MLGSWVRFQLFLGWTLLLGQPVRGEDFEDPQVALEEEDLEEQGSPLGENLVEEALLETLEDLATSGEDSDELERRADMRLRDLEERGEVDPMMDYYKVLALEYYNNHNPGPLYRHLEDTEVQIQKAIGTIVTFTVYLVNTNCTTEDRRTDDPLRAQLQHMGYFGSMEDLGLTQCGLPPESEQEKLKCTFTLFLNGNGYSPSVISHYCQPTNIFDEPLTEE